MDGIRRRPVEKLRPGSHARARARAIPSLHPGLAAGVAGWALAISCLIWHAM